jgi:TusA-related sulfurtransferase
MASGDGQGDLRRIGRGSHAGRGPVASRVARVYGGGGETASRGHRDLMLSLDHLVVAALTLEAGVDHVFRSLGVAIPPGGAHPLMGTHNHLMQLGEGVFLEVIAPDPARQPQRARWYALDDEVMQAKLRVSPRLISWVVRTDDLAASLRAAPAVAGEAVRATRDSLSWLIAVAPDGAMPFDGAFPTLIEWPRGDLPSARMADLGCRLRLLEVAHPDAPAIADALGRMFADDRVKLTAGPEARLVATIATPRGVRRLA